MGLAPNRVDWRWAKAVEAAEYTESQAPHHLRGVDEHVVAAYRFKRAIDNGLPVDGWADIADAYELFTNRPEQRLYVEGMLLSGLTDDAGIATGIDATGGVVSAYDRVFFDVRSRRASEGWIVSQLFQGMLYGNLTPRDRTGLMHRIAWLGGPDLFRSYYTGKYDPSLRDKMMERLNDMGAKQALLTSMCVGHGGGEHQIALMTNFVEQTQEAVAKAAETATGDKGFGDSVLGFLRSVTTRVADPLAPSNVNLSAREPRAHEYEALHAQPDAR